MRFDTFAGPLVVAAAIVAVAVVATLASSDSSEGPRTVSSSWLERTRQQSLSRYRELARDRKIRTRTTLLRSRLVLRRRDMVFVQSDGVFAPLGRRSAAKILIEVDGRRVSNESVIDWSESQVPVQHSFNAIGAVRLSKGTHTVRLVGTPIAGAFSVAATSNLSVFVDPAARVSRARLRRQAGPWEFVSSNRRGRGDRLPHEVLTSVKTDTRSPTVAVASGSVKRGLQGGDAMLGIYVDRRHPGNNSSLWTVNDLCLCAEVQAPLYTQALIQGQRRARLSLEASEYPWDQPGAQAEGEDRADYTVRPSATLIALSGDMYVVGKGKPDRPGTRTLLGSVWDWSCVLRGAATAGHCPRAGSDVRIASETFEVPRGHSGVVMFAAKTRVQAGRHVQGGTTEVWLEIDGKQKGSTGVQQLAAPATISQRTISASYLAARKQRLRPGKHRVEVYAYVEGSFDGLWLSRDLPLVWFD